MLQTRAWVVWIQAVARGFVRAAVSKKFHGEPQLGGHLPWDSRSREPSSHRGDEFAQLPDQDRLEVDFTFGRFPVGAFERRLQLCGLGPSGDKRNIVMLCLLKQPRPLVFTTIEPARDPPRAAELARR